MSLTRAKAGNLTYKNDGTGAVVRTIKDKLGETVSVEDFGAVGDGVTDDTAAIQAAIDAASSVFMPHTSAGYRTTAPIYLSSGKSLFGEAGSQVSIFKTTNTVGSGSNVYGAQTDSYAKDAVVIVTHADNTYATYVNIENINFTSTVDCDYVVYAPRMYVGAFKNVLLGMAGGLYGFVTHDTFMFAMDEVQVAGDNSNVAGSVGFWWDDQGDGSSGTSVSFNRCWVRDGIETAYKLKGLVYSTLTSCGADKYLNIALDINLCDITLNGFGFENRASAGVSPLKLRYSRVNITSAVAFSVNLGVSDYLVDSQGCICKINGLRHTTSTASVGALFRSADNNELCVSGIATQLTTTTPVIDGTSSFYDVDNRYLAGTKKHWNTYGGRYDVSDSSGTQLGFFSELFGTSARLYSTGTLYFGANGGAVWYMTPTVFRPYTADGTINLGAAAQRLNTIYATTGTINTSDEREKTFLSIEDAEKAAALEIKANLRKFKFNDAIDLKGDNARIHFGASAQQVGKILANHGLSPEDYAFYCYDEWDATDEVYDDDGGLMAPAIDAGNRYGIRYDELLAFILAAL